jgi:hypothetical protein
MKSPKKIPDRRMIHRAISRQPLVAEVIRGILLHLPQGKAVCATLHKHLSDYLQIKNLAGSSDLVFCGDDKTKPAQETGFNKSLSALAHIG